MNFIIAAVFDNYVNAHLTLGRLQDEHINCWLKDEHTVSVYPGSTFASGGIKLLVAESQIERALTIINEDKANYNNDHACPDCGSNEIEVYNLPVPSKNWLETLKNALFDKGSASLMETTFHCKVCKKEFTLD